MANPKSHDSLETVSIVAGMHEDTRKTTRVTPVSRDLDRTRADARRAEALSLRLAGFDYSVIGERLNISENSARELVKRTMEKAINHGVEEMRAVENARLDRAQAAIWSRVLNGDDKAIQSFISISQRRARMNGLDAPKQIQLGGSVKMEMEAALGELRQVVLGEIVDAEVLEENGDSDADRDY